MHKSDIIQQKIISRKEIPRYLAYWKFRNLKTVFTNGCFDVIHRGHVEYLAKAADLGSILIVGLNSDKSVKLLKGEGRPLQDEQSRALILASMHFVTAVILFDEETPYNLIKEITPNVLVKGGDYVPEDIVGYDIVKAHKGKVVTIDFVEGYSSTGILNKMKNSPGNSR
jgi:D-glycero-beta-D-manno-heptose 1-phosphate adenylyltransferase